MCLSNVMFHFVAVQLLLDESQYIKCEPHSECSGTTAAVEVETRFIAAPQNPSMLSTKALQKKPSTKIGLWQFLDKEWIKITFNLSGAWMLLALVEILILVLQLRETLDGETAYLQNFINLVPVWLSHKYKYIVLWTKVSTRNTCDQKYCIYNLWARLSLKRQHLEDSKHDTYIFISELQWLFYLSSIPLPVLCTWVWICP